MIKSKAQLSKEVLLLQRIIVLLEEYGEMAHGLDVDDHLGLYREWLQDAQEEQARL